MSAVAVAAAMDVARAVERLPLPRSLGERFVLAMIRLGAGVTAFDGGAMLVAAVPALSLAPDGPRAAVISRGIILIGVALLVSGALSRALLASRWRLLPNERLTRAAGGSLGGWLLMLMAALPLLPLTTFYELAPLRSFWRELFVLARDNGLFEGLMKSSQMSGVVLVPVAAALAVPALAVLAACTFLGSSFLLLPLLLTRSWRFPRAYLACVLLQGALVFACIHGAEVARDVASWVMDEAGRTASFVNTTETAQVLDAVERYNTVLAVSSRSLAWTLTSYAIWLVPLLASPRARETFAVPLEVAESVDASASVVGLAPQP